MSNAGHERRHVASIVLTHALPEDTDLIIETLEQSEFLEVERVGTHYADVTVPSKEVPG